MTGQGFYVRNFHSLPATGLHRRFHNTPQPDLRHRQRDPFPPIPHAPSHSRHRIVSLRSCERPQELEVSRETGVNHQTIRNWIKCTGSGILTDGNQDSCLRFLTPKEKYELVSNPPASTMNSWVSFSGNEACIRNISPSGIRNFETWLTRKTNSKTREKNAISIDIKRQRRKSPETKSSARCERRFLPSGRICLVSSY